MMKQQIFVADSGAARDSCSDSSVTVVEMGTVTVVVIILAIAGSLTLQLSLPTYNGGSATWTSVWCNASCLYTKENSTDAALIKIKY